MASTDTLGEAISGAEAGAASDEQDAVAIATTKATVIAIGRSVLRTVDLPVFRTRRPGSVVHRLSMLTNRSDVRYSNESVASTVSPGRASRVDDGPECYWDGLVDVDQGDNALQDTSSSQSRIIIRLAFRPPALGEPPIVTGGGFRSHDVENQAPPPHSAHHAGRNTVPLPDLESRDQDRSR
ncbi:hypothetical protein D8W71_22085 [Rhodococcus sp. P1Y]|nr:hypothetical protein D8W71_22085 [Rhodococcus sp. P1Y]